MKALLTILFLCFVVSAQGYSDSFILYMKTVENSVKSGFVNGRWYPHNSVEGGAQTIAYGHKLRQGEDFSQGLTEEEAVSLLLKDLARAEHSASSYLAKKYGVDWSVLPEWKQEVFIDFEFNGVLRSFPKFIYAVICDDLAGMSKEYRRYAKTACGKRIELSTRNSGFHKRFIQPLINRT